MKLTDEQIREIADNLDAGLKCFYNLKTGEIKTLLNFDNWAGADMEPWEVMNFTSSPSTTAPEGRFFLFQARASVRKG